MECNCADGVFGVAGEWRGESGESGDSGGMGGRRERAVYHGYDTPPGIDGYGIYGLFEAEFGFYGSCNVGNVRAGEYGDSVFKDEGITAFLANGFNCIGEFLLDGGHELLLLALQVLCSCVAEGVYFLAELLDFLLTALLDGLGGVFGKALILLDFFVDFFLEFGEFALIFLRGFLKLVLCGGSLGHCGEDGVNVYGAEFLCNGDNGQCKSDCCDS